MISARLPVSFLVFLAVALQGQQVTKEPVEEGRKIDVGGYSLFLHCTGSAPGPTVILLSGGGNTSGIWNKVQSGVEAFATVCSYDRMGEGRSDRAIPPLQTAGEIVDDLHSLLMNGGMKPPYILVGHSMGGIYARKFTDSYPSLVSGMVLVDSAHEEQVWRFERISHSLLFEYPAWPDINKLARAGFLPPGRLLQWHHDLPLIVLKHGILWPRGTFKGMSESEYQELRNVLDAMQLDLSRRSVSGELRIAEKSGHFIHRQQPELVVTAIHDVLSRSRR